MSSGLHRMRLLAAWLVPGLLALGCALLLLFRAHPPPPALPSPPPAPPPPLAGVTVILDPGHGGADSGAVCHGVCEAALTYRTAVELAEDIRRQGGQVLFTVRSRMLAPPLAVTEPPPQRPWDAVLAVNGQPLRERETPRPLWLRAAVARRLWRSASPGEADSLFFLSLHFDDFHRRAVQGALVCVDRRARSVPPLARLLAAYLCAGGLARHDVYHGLRGLAAVRLGVLDPKYNPVPERVLVELATISNESDARLAADPDWRRGIVLHITDALIAVHQEAHLSSRPHPAVQ